MSCQNCGCNPDGILEVPGIQGTQGPPGDIGPQGADGADGVSFGFKFTTLVQDNVHCPCTGTQVDYGKVDSNGAWVGPVISTFYNCNGCKGDDLTSRIGMYVGYDGNIFDPALFLQSPDPNWGLGIGNMLGYAYANGNNGTRDIRGRTITCTGLNQTPNIGPDPLNPDINPLYVLGDGDSLGQSIGQNKHSLVEIELAPHVHGPGNLSTGNESNTHRHYITNDVVQGTVDGDQNGSPKYTETLANKLSEVNDIGHTHNVTTGQTDAGTNLLTHTPRHENRPPFLALHILKRVS